MLSEVVHRESYRTLKVLVNAALLAVVGEPDLLVEECKVSALSDVLVDRREEPERIVGTVAGVSRLLNVLGIVRSVLLTGLMCVLYKRKSRSVSNLSREHEPDLFLGHLGSEMDDALDILNRITVAEAVSETAVLEGRRT